MKNTELVRTGYIEKYGKEAWVKAVSLESRQRYRAATKHGLSEHFTAPEWLDLCAQTRFCCTSCGEKLPLEAHHKLALAASGSNTIDNISPLCNTCHVRVPKPCLGIKDFREEWIAEQNAVYSKRPSVGALVQMAGWQSVKCSLGVVLETTPPFIEAGPLWCHSFTRDKIRAAHEFDLKSRGFPTVQPRHAIPLVCVQRAGEDKGATMAMCDVCEINVNVAKSTALEWIEAQSGVLATWNVGDRVSSHNKSNYRAKQGIIEKVIPYKALSLTGFAGEEDFPHLPIHWVPLSDAIALVRWQYYDGTSKATRMSFKNIGRLDATGKRLRSPKAIKLRQAEIDAGKAAYGVE